VVGEAMEANEQEEKVICLHCEQPIELGKRVFVIPFPTYAEDAYLFAHPKCMPQLEGRENILDGYYVEGSERVFVPRQVVEALKEAEGGQG
jgi:hypothetical protein